MANVLNPSANSPLNIWANASPNTPNALNLLIKFSLIAFPKPITASFGFAIASLSLSNALKAVSWMNPIKTSNKAFKGLKTLVNASTPLCVDANAAINPPKATTIAPIPVDINAIFNIFNALENLPVDATAAVFAAAAPSVACADFFVNTANVA